MKNLFTGFIPFIMLLMSSAMAQVTFPVNGIPDQRHLHHAFINARLWIDYKTVADSATLLIFDDIIVASGKGIKIPEGAVIHDLSGRSIYPSFIDLYTQYGITESPAVEKPKGPQLTSATEGSFSWNQALKPEVEANRLFVINENRAENFRNAGFGTVLTFSHDGIARGTAALVSLAGGSNHDVVLKEKAASCYSLKKGSSRQDYPTSEMGAIALIRQAYLDADWYKTGGKEKEYNISIQSWIDNQGIPQIFESDNRLQSLRIDRIGEEAGVNYIIRGSGDEYQRLGEIKGTGNAFIIPLNYPKPYDVSDPYDAINLTLEELKHWEMAPANPFLMNSDGVEIAFTTNGLKEPDEFLEQLRKAISYGLPAEAALKACTHTPAALIGMGNKLGSLKKGMIASFIITSGDLFKKDNIIFENWVQGKPYVINHRNASDIRGKYSLKLNDKPQYQLLISGEIHDLKAKVVDGTDSVNAEIEFSNYMLSIKFNYGKDSSGAKYTLNGFSPDQLNTTFKGNGMGPRSMSFSWEAIRTGATRAFIQIDTLKIEKPVWGRLLFPNKAYGFEKMPEQETILFRNVTVWTNEKEGILNNTDVLISKGKIIKIGKSLDGTGATVVDGTGKHLTSGIIDEHSHIAVSGNVNECSHSVTSEVRIGDVINSDDINIYRQLSGGVTTSQLLHGSCNAIGGQAALIKLRWGQSPEKMKFEGADGFIKFALGENVKQTNFGDEFKIRYPQTRMGVEQVYLDAFQRAKEYENALVKFTNKEKGAIKPRRDLRLDALVEIMNRKRFITCHSYQQGEINMLMHVADSMGFKVNTFTHILEGYKVADKMKAHGVGASSFSDWWAYKYEVIEAIPYNGSILHDMGVITAFNSDDPEMARRLNQEAAKAVKYGGLSEEEALKFVTLNPAKLLHIDNRVGSIKEGKDADIVLWSDHPLSIYSKAVMTFVDGIRYYDSQRDEMNRKEISLERSRLISKMQLEKNKKESEELKKPVFNEELIKHCMDDE